MIRDLEEQLLRVPESGAREYLAEAVRCYHAGAFRASVVQAVATGIHDLREKLGRIVASHGAPQPLITSVKAIEGKFSRQEPIEQDVVEAAEKDAGLLTPAEAKSCRTLLQTRNLCAHPSGHSGSAEEARDAITKVVDIILTKPALMGMVAIDELVDRLSSPTFFPKPDISTEKIVVEAEIKGILPHLLPALASRVLSLLHAEATNATNSPLSPASPRRMNSRRFLRGLTALGHGPSAAVWESRAMADLICRTECLGDALGIMMGDTSVVTRVDALTHERILASVRHNIAAAAIVRRTAGALLNSAFLSPEEREDLYLACHSALIAGWTGATDNGVRDIGHARLTESYLDALIERCGSTTWDVANPAISVVQDLPAEVATFLTRAQLRAYLLNVSTVARGPYSSRRAASLLTSGMGNRMDAIDALVEVSVTDPDNLSQSSADWLAVADLMTSSGRAADVVAVLSVVRDQLLNDLEALQGLAKHADPGVSAFGASLLAEAKQKWQEAESPF